MDLAFCLISTSPFNTACQWVWGAHNSIFRVIDQEMTYYKPFSFLMGISMGKWPISPKIVIFKHVAKGCQGPRGTPGMGEMSYNQIDHI